MSNLGSFLVERFNHAVTHLDTEDQVVLRESMDELKDLLLDPSLPRLLRLRANFALADLEDEFDLAEAYRVEAERVYTEIRSIWHVGDQRHPTQEALIVQIREGLDELAQEFADEARSEIFVQAGSHALTESQASEQQNYDRSRELYSSQDALLPAADSQPTSVEDDDGERSNEDGFIIPLRNSPAATRFLPPLQTDVSRRSPRRRTSQEHNSGGSPFKKRMV